MSNIVLRRLVNIDFQKLRNMMIRNRIYADDLNGKPRMVGYSYTTARHLHACIKQGSKRKVYIRTDGIY